MCTLIKIPLEIAWSLTPKEIMQRVDAVVSLSNSVSGKREKLSPKDMLAFVGD
jgi:hypothetical protein